MEIHDTVFIAAAFCMFNRYVDGLATFTPTDHAAYDQMGQRMAKQGYVQRLSHRPVNPRLPTANDDCRLLTAMPHITLPDDLPGIRGPMAFRPETAKPLNELVDVLLRGPHTLTPGERELIATFVSSQNDCRYCQTIHGAIAAHHLGGNEDLVVDVKPIRSTPPSRDKLKALLVIAGKTADSGKHVTAERRRARARAGRHRPRDSRHGAHRRGVLHVQPLRRRPGHVGARRSRFLSPARRARRRSTATPPRRSGGPADRRAIDRGSATSAVDSSSDACLRCPPRRPRRIRPAPSKAPSPTRRRRRVAGARSSATQPRNRLHPRGRVRRGRLLSSAAAAGGHVQRDGRGAAVRDDWCGSRSR